MFDKANACSGDPAYHKKEFPVDSYQVKTCKYQFKYLNMPPHLGDFNDTRL